eukprot:TRINITY_DN4194_c1_g1_i2.p2 TRINITY_DN4194_c1_g1~~TRINITY_DN4194_c1_g1_i2.p2  ORF type:complete len:180 (+),score=43.82 TRINITY_DN4194_c1_g1_i2:80-619(+)
MGGQSKQCIGKWEGGEVDSVGAPPYIRSDAGDLVRFAYRNVKRCGRPKRRLEVHDRVEFIRPARKSEGEGSDDAPKAVHVRLVDHPSPRRLSSSLSAESIRDTPPRGELRAIVSPVPVVDLCPREAPQWGVSAPGYVSPAPSTYHLCDVHTLASSISSAADSPKTYRHDPYAWSFTKWE